MKYSRIFPLVIAIFLASMFFIPSLLQGKNMLPADTIVGLYHPYRDLYASDYPNGIPYKNFLVTDPVRQQYPWKFLGVTSIKQQSLPVWNPYTFGGTPLLANFQTAAFYPLNILFISLPFIFGWNIFILLQPILASIFMYLYLRNLKLSIIPSLLGGFVFAYCGFSVAWLEWGNIMHTGLWLPLILLSIDSIVKQDKNTNVNTKSIALWSLLLTFSLLSAFFAGHLQTFFYLGVVSAMYFLARWLQYGRKFIVLVPFVLCTVLVIGVTSIQWYPTFQFILSSARSLDQMEWQKDGWFIPWQHSIQFLAPDFFGNPATLNYFSVWNYGEFIGYVGIAPLFLSLYALVMRHDKKTRFFFSMLIVALLFAFPTLLARLPFSLGVPFLSTAQPTRLLFVIDFSLAVLASLGLDYLIKSRKSLAIPFIFLAGCFAALWITILLYPSFVSTVSENTLVAKRNLQLPTALFLVSAIILFCIQKIRLGTVRYVVIVALILVSVIDLLRFTGKFLPLTDTAYIYPQTKTISYLKQHLGTSRFLSLDSRIMPPNFSLMYGMQTVEGYDPLYLRRYAELLAASERKKPDISPPFGFNRIITPHEFSSPIINLLGVTYILSLEDITNENLVKVFEEGETRIYENKLALPRAFMVTKVTVLGGEQKQQAIDFLYSEKNLAEAAVVEHALPKTAYASGSATIVAYTPNKVTIQTDSQGEGFLVLTDTYYPTWRATLVTPGTSKTVNIPIYRTDFQFRGVVVPAGSHTVEFTNTLFTL